MTRPVVAATTPAESAAVTAPGKCAEGCGGTASREILDRVTRVPLGVFLCDFGARNWGLSDTRAIRSSESTSAPELPPGSGASVAAGATAVAGIPVPVIPPRGSSRRRLASAGQSS